jgi:hypothetical protein
MSCDIRKYNSIDIGGDGKPLYLTAFVGGEEYGASIQFTIGNNYCALSRKMLDDLIITINKRLMHDDGYTATGEERKNIEYKG